VVAADHERGWMLMRELPGETARATAGHDAWWSAVEVLSRIHQAFAGRNEDVLAAGAPHRGLAHVREAIETLVGVDARGAALLRAACDELAIYDLPETLVHGDFHRGNVSVDGGRPVIFDWSDACLAHPLVDMHALFAYDEEPARSDSLRRYAAGWPTHERERILAACRFAEPLACVHQAVTYEALAAASEPPDRLWFVAEPPDWIERALESAARL
jgi:aminoglycoside phosphotransferase (APT) family kinase protein